MKHSTLKGMKDVLPDESYKWQYFEKMARQVCAEFGYREIRTPVVEHTELFLRGVGDTTDIVQKEMYTFEDKGGRSITMKPEGTAGVVRSYIEHGLFNEPQPSKLYYLFSPTFRYERPQAGRLREHHQFGVEIFGAAGAAADAEMISLVLTLLNRLGLRELALNINSIGCPKCRPAYNEKLKEYYAQYIDGMCGACRDRFERNPLRLLDCKEPHCSEIAANAPSILEYLCEECSGHFDDLKSCLDGIGIEYSINPSIVRGLDYYTKTVFEVISTHIGSQGTVTGGGRYDKLVETCGGPQTPGAGFGMGMERVLLVMEAQGVEIPQTNRCDAYVITFKEAGRALQLANMLRQKGVSADFDPLERSMKAQMRAAEKAGAKVVIIEGGDEREAGVVQLKIMETGEQLSMNMEDAVNFLKEGERA